MPRDDKTDDDFAHPRHRSIEEQKGALRLEDAVVEADACPECLAVRAVSKDPTDLCATHLRKIYGL